MLLSSRSPSNSANAALLSTATASGHVCSCSIALALRMFWSISLCFQYRFSGPLPDIGVMLAIAARESIRLQNKAACSAGSSIARCPNPSVSVLTESIRHSRISSLMRPGRSTKLRYMYAIIRALADPRSCCCPRVPSKRLAGPQFEWADLFLSTHHHASVGLGDKPMNSTQRKAHWLTLLTMEDSCPCASFLVTQPIALVAQFRSASLVQLVQLLQLHSHPKELLQCGQLSSDHRAPMVVCRRYKPI